METEVVGYKLVEIATDNVVNQWGGIQGQCPGVPSFIILPNGDAVHAPVLDADYNGYKLVNWEMEKLPPVVLSPEQKLQNAGLTVEDLKALLGLA